MNFESQCDEASLTAGSVWLQQRLALFGSCRFILANRLVSSFQLTKGKVLDCTLKITHINVNKYLPFAYGQ